MGVNLAGVSIILELLQKLRQIQAEKEALLRPEAVAANHETLSARQSTSV
jgi:hypothetical protein